jgi:hypothetical protein
VTFAIQPVSVRDQTASPRLPSLSKVHDRIIAANQFLEA